jgi:hypothetical protein
LIEIVVGETTEAIATVLDFINEYLLKPYPEENLLETNWMVFFP